MARRYRKQGTHRLKKASARTISLGNIFRMTDLEAEAAFARLRWHQNDGKPICRHCGSCDEHYDCRRPNGTFRYRCSGCAKDIGLTAGTSFAHHKLPIRDYLAAIVIYVNNVKGSAALMLSRELNVQYKTAFVLEHKLRECIHKEVMANNIGGLDKIVEIDGCFIGGYEYPENRKAKRKDMRRKENQNGKEQCVVAITERGGRTKTKVFQSEDDSGEFIRDNLDKGTIVHADEAPAWDKVVAPYKNYRVNHSVEYFGEDKACTNHAEGLFNRLRRSEIGIHHHISGAYAARYANEIAWREDFKDLSNGDQFEIVGRLVGKTAPSIDFVGYWQRNWAA